MRSLIRWLVEHPTTVWIAATAVFLFGVLSYATLPRESSPDITIPVVVVSTPYVGVSPEDIETLISVPMENELASLRNVKEMSSTSAEGVSIVVLEFEPDTVVEDALQRVRDRVGRVRPTLPTDAEEPSVREISFSDIPVVLITLAGEAGEDTLKALAEDLQDDLTRIDGVLDVDLTGGTEREVQIHVIPERLAYYGLAMHDVTGAIGDENVNIPGGNVEVGRGNFLLRVPGEFDDPREIGQVAIKRVGDRPVFVRDVARVVDGYEERETYSRMAGQASVTLAVKKRAGSNILRVASEAKTLAAQHAESWPDNVTWRALGDESKYIDQMVSDLQNNIITALILVVSVIIFFLGFRPSAFVAISIPLSMLASMMVLDLLGFTLNMIVLFSLILALGMLVDNAIVVVENVYRHREMGKDAIQAAIDGTDEVAIAVAASTATTVAAFFPLVFWTGIMGEFMGFLPKTVIIVLIMSLVMAVGVLPVVMSRLMPANVGDSVRSSGDLRDAELSGVMSAYRDLLRLSIRRRYVSAAAVVSVLFVTFGIYGGFNHGTEFFPATEPDRAIVGVRLPQGTGVETTDRVVREVERILATQPNIDTWVADVGVSAGGDPLSGSQASPNEARLTVDFHPDRNTAKRGETARVEPSSATVERLRGMVAEIPGAKISVEPQEMGPPVGKPINVEISGEDYDAVGEVAVQMRREIERTVAGVTDLEDNYGVGRPELQLRIDRGAAKRVGVSTAEVGNAVRSAVAGTVATTLRDGEDEIDVVVELAPEYREDLQQVLTLRLPGREDTSPDTFPVPLSTVATYDFVGGSSGINHIDQEMVVTISGDVAEGMNENEVRAAVQTYLDAYDLPSGMATSLTGANEEQEDAAIFLVRAFFIAVALILLVLVTQFDSVTMPGIIVGTVVLSLIGVLWGLMITGTPFGIIMTGIGVISLAGVVVNNAIVLLDYVEQLRARGLSVEDALVEAGLTRFRPVVLTAITTALGLVPMALGTSFDFIRFKLIVGSTSAQWWGPMAIAVIFGLSFATLLTLVMVPTLYSINNDLQGLRIGSRLGWRSVSAAGATTVGLLALVLWPSTSHALTLEEAWAAAENDDLSLAIAREDATQISTLRGKAWSTLSPRVSANGAYIINNQQIAFQQDPFFALRVIGPAINGITKGFGQPPVLPTDPCPEGATPTTGSQELTCLPEPFDVVIQEQTFLQGSATVTQRLFSGTALPGLRAANKLHAAGQEDLRAAVMRSKSQVAQAFYGVLAATQAEQVSANALEIAQSQLELARRRFEAGLDDKRGQIQAQLAVSRAERDLQSARESLLEVQTSFEMMTGLDGANLVLPEPFRVPTDVDVALADARSRRPDIRAAGYRVDALKAQRTAQDLRWLPTLDAVGTVNWTENTGFNDQNFTWNVALSANWELWDGGLRTAERRETASQARSAAYAKRLTDRVAEREIRLAFEAHRRAEEALQAVADELELATQSLELAERSFQSGGATWLELEQARLQLQGTQLSQLQERTARDLAAIDLLVRTGAL
ncbi:MAG: efflux RND transporter permease subunit [Myxococcales bacterium]|nr:efflux RND transporter permease subunit [Myxococcales bacterium]